MSIRDRLENFSELEPLSQNLVLPVTYAQAFYAFAHERKNDLSISATALKKLTEAQAQACEALHRAASGEVSFDETAARELEKVISKAATSSKSLDETKFWSEIESVVANLAGSKKISKASDWLTDSMSAARLAQALGLRHSFFSNEFASELSSLETLESSIRAQIRALGGAIVARKLEPTMRSRSLKDETDSVHLSVRYLVAFASTAPLKSLETGLSGWFALSKNEI